MHQFKNGNAELEVGAGDRPALGTPLRIACEEGVQDSRRHVGKGRRRCRHSSRWEGQGAGVVQRLGKENGE